MKKALSVCLFCVIILSYVSFTDAALFEMPSVLSDDAFNIVVPNTDNNTDNDLVIRGKSRKSKSKSSGSYKIWADFAGYSGSLPEMFAGAPESDVDGFGFNVGIGFPRKSKSLSIFYTHNAPTQDYGIAKFETENHLFGVICDKTTDIFQYFAMANAGFDKYTLLIPGSSFDWDGWQMNFYGELAAELPVGNWNIRPHLGLGYHYLSTDIPAVEKTMDALESNLGVRVLRNCLGQMLVFQGRASWIHQYLDQAPIYRMRYGSQVGVMSPTQYYLLGGNPGRDWICCGAGLKYYIIDPFSISVDYDLNVSKNITMHIGSISARLIW